MKKLLLFVFLFVSMSNFANYWYESFEEAQKMALASNKLILIDFWATWCGPCKKMDVDTWNNAEVKTLIEDFVLLKVDIDSNRELAGKYSVSSIPNIFIVDPNGKKIYSFLGYKSPNELKKEVKDYILNTEYLSNELINHFKQANYSTALRLTQKYFDYALLVDKNIKNAFINISSEYLEDAKSKLDKKDADYTDKLQRLKLLELYEYVYKFNFEKLEKKLNDKFPENSIAENNKLFYSFLKYAVTKGLNKPEAEVLKTQLLATENLASLPNKVEKVLEFNK